MSIVRLLLQALLATEAACFMQRAPIQGKYDPLAHCPGYRASNLRHSPDGFTAQLDLAGPPCNTYGDDLANLTLIVSYETESRLHILIQDAGNGVYQVPQSVLPRPAAAGWPAKTAELKFDYTTNPFSFKVSRSKTGEVLFDTSGTELVFQSQYLRLRTKLPQDPNLYGLGEHSDPFRLNTTSYTRTLWSLDSYAVPEGENLYGNHPVYFDHRTSGTHGVFFLNSNGMDIFIDKTAEGNQYLEYNTLGGVFDFYFMAGPSPVDVAQQYADIVGLPAMMPYWGLGYHNCRYGYQDAFEVAEVVQNYSNAKIPLETMWTDIDYMDGRSVFSLDPDRFSLKMMRELVNHLHANDQSYIVMVDPAVAYQPYAPFERGVKDNVFMLRHNGSIWKGVVWPGVTAFPDWFSANISGYWDNEFAVFFSPVNGVDIDGLWIDMNEPSNFPCNFPCENPDVAAIGYPPKPPPVRAPPRPLPGWPCDFQPPGTCKNTEPTHFSNREYTTWSTTHELALIRPREEPGKQLGVPGRDLLYPKYAIHNAAAYKQSWNADKGGISNRSVNTDLLHQNGLALYDTHNLYGTMMSTLSYDAMAYRRPAHRPLVITRSTFAGAGAKVGHWTGDNLATWAHYRLSIRAMLAFASLYQIPMVGSDVCGFSGDTTEELCQRWAALGAFNPFFRNHNNLGDAPQEFYRWDSVAEVARKAIERRYRLLDYLYTALYTQATTGVPALSPMWFPYPGDAATFALELQFFYGPALLVAPVTEQGASSVQVYLPADVFYDYETHKKVQGEGAHITVADQGPADIPLFLRGGVIVPRRVRGGMTTTEVRAQDFELLVPLAADGTARGRLYLDDGINIKQKGVSVIEFVYAEGKLTATGTFGFTTELKIRCVTVLGLDVPKEKEGKLKVRGAQAGVGGQTVVSVVGESGAASFAVEASLMGGFEVELMV